MIYDKICPICQTYFLTKTHNKTFCSDECFTVNRNLRRQQTEKINTYVCKNCDSHFQRSRIRNGFCSRSCASKWHLNNGTYDKWRQGGIDNNKNAIKPLVCQKCIVCDTEYHIKQKEAKRNRSKTCSVACRRKYHSKKISGENNHFYGKKFPEIWNEKRKETLKKKFGVENAFALSKQRTKSKGQIELYELMKVKFPNTEVHIEKLVLQSPYMIFADIVFPTEKIIVEYHGDFWHCNPYKYEATYYNPKKQLTAQEIWSQDQKRKELLEKENYKVFIVWESDFKKNKEQTLSNLIKEISGVEHD